MTPKKSILFLSQGNYSYSSLESTPLSNICEPALSLSSTSAQQALTKVCQTFSAVTDNRPAI